MEEPAPGPARGTTWSPAPSSAGCASALRSGGGRGVSLWRLRCLWTCKRTCALRRGGVGPIGKYLDQGICVVLRDG